MNRSRELPLIDPVYSTYHRQGSASAIIASNPSIRNWYLNNSVMLRCNRKFLHGFTTPEISVCKSNLTDNPYIHKTVIPMQYLNGYVHFVIREILNRGDYLYFDKLDDFYIKGKTWSGIRHFTHDGLISGYDLDKNTYTLFAYDSDWRYRSFIVNKDDIEKARRAVFKNNEYGSIIALKPDDKIIELDPRTIIIKLREHITSDIQKFPPVGDDTVYGIVVHEYIAKYLDMLIDQSIPYEKTDKRVFRMIWEHKKVMLERMLAVCNFLEIDNSSINGYSEIVQKADNMRMLYATHNLKRRDSVLPVIKEQLIEVNKQEKELLKKFIEITERRLS